MVTNIAVNWKGISGQIYSYTVHSLNERWYNEPGNYLFAKQVTGGGWVAVYIGETSSLKDRLAPFSNHEKGASAHRNGVTHIHAHRSSDQQQIRRSEEADLVNNYRPVCNGTSVP